MAECEFLSSLPLSECRATFFLKFVQMVFSWTSFPYICTSKLKFRLFSQSKSQRGISGGANRSRRFHFVICDSVGISRRSRTLLSGDKQSQNRSQIRWERCQVVPSRGWLDQQNLLHFTWYVRFYEKYVLVRYRGQSYRWKQIRNDNSLSTLETHFSNFG